MRSALLWFNLATCAVAVAIAIYDRHWGVAAWAFNCALMAISVIAERRRCP